MEKIFGMKHKGIPSKVISLSTKNHVEVIHCPWKYLGVPHMGRVTRHLFNDWTKLCKGESILGYGYALVAFTLSIFIFHIACIKKVQLFFMNPGTARVAPIFVVGLIRKQ